MSDARRLLLVHAHRLTAAEVPVRMRPRQAGVSSINATRSVLYMTKVLLALFVGLLRSRPAVESGDAAAVQTERSI